MTEPLRYKNMVTIVTGGSQGIGRGCVEVFVQHGSKVVFGDIAVSEGKELEAEMNQRGPGEAMFVRCDTTSELDVQNLVTTAVEKYGRLDCVISNAGDHPPAKTIDEIEADEFRKLLDTNLVSYFLVAKYALPHLRKTKGSLIQNASLVAEIGQSGACTYVATKGGVKSFTKALAIDEAKHGVRVNSISPGCIWTPLFDRLVKLTPDENKTVQDLTDTQLLGRFGTPEECGKTCLFLASDATFCTGININLSGGAEINYGKKNPNAS